MTVPKSNQLIKIKGGKVVIAGRTEYLLALDKAGVDIHTLAEVHAELLNPGARCEECGKGIPVDPKLESNRLRALSLAVNHVLGMKTVAGKPVTADEESEIQKQMAEDWAEKNPDAPDNIVAMPHREDLS